MLLRLIFALFAATAGWAVASGVVVTAAALAWHWAWHGAEALSPWLETLPFGAGSSRQNPEPNTRKPASSRAFLCFRSGHGLAAWGTRPHCEESSKCIQPWESKIGPHCSLWLYKLHCC